MVQNPIDKSEADQMEAVAVALYRKSSSKSAVHQALCSIFPRYLEACGRDRAFSEDILRRAQSKARHEDDGLPGGLPETVEDCEARALEAYIRGDSRTGDMHAARWLLKYRPIVTEPMTGKMFAYDEKKGHYVRTGEALLRSDLVQKFGSRMTRARVSEILAKCSALTYRDVEELGATTPPNLLPFENGIYDLGTKQLLPHSPEYFFTYVHPVKYAPASTCPAIDTFLLAVVDRPNEELLRDIAALCLYRDRLTRHFFILVGEGHNGKSIFLTLVRRVIGESRCVSITPHNLEKRDFTAVQLHDKHADLGADIPGGVIADLTIIKSVTGGDYISVESKGVDRFETKSYAEIVYSSNTPPRFSENTRAVYDRLVVITFPYNFLPASEISQPTHKLEDLRIKEQLLTSEELSGFLNVLLDRLPLLIEKRALSIVVSPEKTRADYAQVTNTPLVFLETCCEQVPYIPGDKLVPSEGWASRAELYAKYKQFCAERKLHIESQATFGRRILEAPSWSIEAERETVNGGRVVSYRGVQLAQQAQLAPKSLYSTNYKPENLKNGEQNRENRCQLCQQNPPKPSEIESLQDVLTTVKQREAVTLAELAALCNFENGAAFIEKALKIYTDRGDIFENPAGTWRARQ